jgi:hypothetical protein
MPLIEQHNGHMGMAVMLSFAGHLTGAAVDTTVEVHKYDFHPRSFNLALHFNIEPRREEDLSALSALLTGLANFARRNLKLRNFRRFIQRIHREDIRSGEMKGHENDPRRQFLGDAGFGQGISPPGSNSYFFIGRDTKFLSIPGMDLYKWLLAAFEQSGTAPGHGPGIIMHDHSTGG